MRVYLKMTSLGYLILLAFFAGCQTVPQNTSSTQDDLTAPYNLHDLTARYKRLAVASVSDAVDQVVGKRGYMSHEIKPLFPVKICGPAVTVLATPSSKKEPPTMALDLVETADPGSVLVIVMEGSDGADIAAFGGIMCTGAKARGLEAAVLDGGCRDLAEIEEMGFPVYAKGIVPSSSVGRYVNISKNEPVNCGGVTVYPGDILVGDRDGIVVVPQAQAIAVLEKAEELEAAEMKTMRDVKRLKSIKKATELNQRI